MTTNFDIGQQVVSRVLADKAAKEFLDHGWGPDWINDPANIYKAVVFPGEHGDAWRSILRHLGAHGVIPNTDQFQAEFPQYKLAGQPATPGELIERGSEKIRKVAASEALGDLRALHDADDYATFADRCMSASVFMQNLGRDSNTLRIWDGGGQDVEALLSRKVKRGVETGIDAIDSQRQFTGWQPGNLVTYLGRAKSGKTSLALLSALHASSVQYKRVLIVTVEISAQDIQDRLDAFAAHVGLTRLMLGELRDDDEKDKVRRVYRDKEEYEPSVYIIEPAERYTVTDLQADIDKYQPDYVVVDGFYFMTDRISGKPGAHWEGHDNLAREVKRLAMQARVVILVTHQVREKQLGGKKGAGIDDGAMMGGTGLIMASDMVLGLDVNDDRVHKITCTRSRSQYFAGVRGDWDWETSTFTAHTEDTDANEG